MADIASVPQIAKNAQGLAGSRTDIVRPWPTPPISPHIG
jgi:hypothetical protein